MNVYIDKNCYEQLLDFMNGQVYLDLRGDFIDMDLFYNDEWLLDSAVVENVVERSGNWDIYLVFAHVQNPMRLIKKKITKCTTIQKAELTANYMRRLAAKDQRGTLKIESSSFSNCNN